MASEYTNIGRVAPYYKGVWSSTAAYTRLDIVSNEDRTAAYIARKSVPAGTALTDEAYWLLTLDVTKIPVDAETIDLRTDYTGAKYDSTGEAVRTPMHDLRDRFDSIFIPDPEINLFDGVTYLRGYYIDKTSAGEMRLQKRTNATDGIVAVVKIEPGKTYSIRKQASAKFAYATHSAYIPQGSATTLVDGTGENGLTVTFRAFTATATDQYLYIYFDTDSSAECYIQVLEGTVQSFRGDRVMYTPSPTNNAISRKDAELLHFKPSPNLYNKYNTTWGAVVGSADGTISANADYGYSELIPVKGGAAYCFTARNATDKTGVHSIAQYSFDPATGAVAFIQRNNTDGATTRTMNNAASFVRLNLSINDTDAMFCEGTELPAEYQPYRIPDDAHFEEYVKGKAQPMVDAASAELNAKIETSTISPEDAELLHFKPSPNLYNKYNTTWGSNISTTGEIAANADYGYSELIPVTGGATYCFTVLNDKTGIQSIAQYKLDPDTGEPVFLYRNNTDGVSTRTMNLATRFVRLNIGVMDEYTMFCEGTELPAEYQPCHLPDDAHFEQYVQGKVRALLKAETTALNRRRYRMEPGGCREIYAPDAVKYTTASLPTVADVFAGYDALMAAYPDYISRTAIGLDQSGAYTLYAYTFSPELVGTEEYMDRPYLEKFTAVYPKILITTGLHGDEYPSVVAMLNLMHAVCTGWKENACLDYLRHNVQFEIVPSANPWGFDNSHRWNSNKVDLNRNFPISYWKDQGSDLADNDGRYRGESAGSEAETKALCAWMASHTDAAIMFDLHTWGTGQATWDKLFYIEFNETPVYSDLANVCLSTVSQTTRMAQKKYNVPEDSGMLGGMRFGNRTAAINAYAKDNLGIPALCPECAWRYVDGERDTDDVNRLDVFYAAAFIVNILNNLM